MDAVVRPRARRQSPARPRARLELLPVCRLVVDGGEVPLCLRVQRLLALLALRGRPVLRVTVAGTLWPDSTPARAGSSLRSTLHQLPVTPVPLALVTDRSVQLSPAVVVDWARAQRLADRVLGGDPTVPAGTALRVLRHGLLPDWSEEWLTGEQNAFRRLQLEALGALAGRLQHDGRAGPAADARVLGRSLSRHEVW